MGSPPIEIAVCPPQHLAGALDLVLRDLPDVARQEMIRSHLAAARQEPESTAGLLVALEDAQLRAAVWAQHQPGRTAVLWPPVVKLAPSVAIARTLVDQAVRYLDAAGVSMAQTLLADPGDRVIEILKGAGFFHLANLSYLVCECEAWKPTADPGGLEFEPYRDAEQSRLASLLEATYIDTQDCPQLNGLRDLADVIEGYRASGESGDRHWYFVRHEKRDVGVLLLASHAGPRHWEIVYMALVPAARGNRWGLLVCEQAVRLAQAARQIRVVLAVDDGNRPALDVYRRVGFRCWEGRTVFVRRSQRPQHV